MARKALGRNRSASVLLLCSFDQPIPLHPHLQQVPIPTPSESITVRITDNCTRLPSQRSTFQVAIQRSPSYCVLGTQKVVQPSYTTHTDLVALTFTVWLWPFGDQLVIKRLYHVTSLEMIQYIHQIQRSKTSTSAYSHTTMQMFHKSRIRASFWSMYKARKSSAEVTFFSWLSSTPRRSVSYS